MRKMVMLLLASLIMLTAACGSSETKDSGSDQSPTGKDEITISLVGKDLPPDARVIKGIEEGMKEEGKNIKLEVVPVQSGTYSEKLGLLLQSGTIPDLIYFQGGDYPFAMTQQILEDLTPYIEQSTYVKASMNSFNQERTQNYPYLVWLSPTNSQIPVMRQDWFDQSTTGKELLANPTIDNYYTFFKDVKEKNGAKFAYTTAGNLDELDVMFGQAFGLTTKWIKGDDGKYEFGRTTPFEKEKLEFYAKLYREGLLDPEFLTKKWDTKEKGILRWPSCNYRRHARQSH